MDKEPILKTPDKDFKVWGKEEIFSKIEDLLLKQHLIKESIESAKDNEATGIIRGTLFLNFVGSKKNIIRGSVESENMHSEFQNSFSNKLKIYIDKLPEGIYTPEHLSFEYKIFPKDTKKYKNYLDSYKQNLLV